MPTSQNFGHGDAALATGDSLNSSLNDIVRTKAIDQFLDGNERAFVVGPRVIVDPSFIDELVNKLITFFEELDSEVRVFMDRRTAQQGAEPDALTGAG
jgi:hypothetical protein